MKQIKNFNEKTKVLTFGDKGILEKYRVVNKVLEYYDYYDKKYYPVAYFNEFTLGELYTIAKMCGDFNVVHKEIDIYEFEKKVNKYAGLYDKERENFEKLLDNKYIDCFRHFDKSSGKYTYWNQRIPKLRLENKGWRLDYFLIDKKNIRNVLSWKIKSEIMGSDHCTLELSIKKL